MNPTKLKTEGYKAMKRLRLLQFANVNLVGDFKCLSTDFRWFCWVFVVSIPKRGLRARATAASDPSKSVAIALKTWPVSVATILAAYRHAF
ncbi:hypothetical protein PIB30_014836 [Stylosanthes scabra]|uniref:Uncharacterized protein n=1 Tax=Stylosanthes scabra TaxID=79078 RepID=A0ABU6R752_9FABA|nr:hypothetical protein [Stylosanthes scabra]